METRKGIKKTLKIAIIVSIIVGTTGFYMLKKISYNPSAISPVTFTRSSSLKKVHGYNEHQKTQTSARGNSSSRLKLYDSDADVTHEMKTDSAEQHRVPEKTSRSVTDTTVYISKRTPSRNSNPKRTMTMDTIGKTFLAINFKSSDITDNKTGAYNIMAMKTIKFDPAYKNPCWKGPITHWPSMDERLHCVPYFYIIGVKKSGTTDLYARILNHPEVCYPGFKESQWMSKLRFGFGAALLRLPQMHELLRKGPNVRSLSFYVSMFGQARKCIQAQPLSDDKITHSQRYNFITGDATPSLMHLHTHWDMLPGNEGLDEPKYTNFHYIKHLTPQAKIIVMFRDPKLRLYSDFHHIMKRAKMENAPKLFHSHVTKLVKTYEDCFMDYTVRQCIYNDTLQQTLIRNGVKLAESFRAGFYAFYMKELLSVFRPDQLLPLLMLDYKNDMKATLKRTFRFLGLRPLDKSTMDKILEEEVQNSGQVRKSHYGDMLAKTKSLLKHFYKSYNAEMAKLMGDTRYLFEEA